MSSTTEHVLIVGCGDLGAHLAKLLCALNIQVTGISRSEKSIEGVQMLVGDVTLPSSLLHLKTLNPSTIVYCVAANGQSDAQYQMHYVEGLKNILNTQTHNPNLKAVMFVSSTRVYGQITDAILNEQTPAIPSDFGGERLLEAEGVLDSLSCSTTVLRLSGIYGPGRLRMINLAKVPERWPEQNSWTNRIHRDDAASFIAYLISKRLAGEQVDSCYIVTDSAPCSQFEVLNWLADNLEIKAFKSYLPILSGKRLSNQAMLATGFTLRYPDYQAGYASLLKSSS
jgi:nucleoside-diphosphate-sugar epimerase